MMQLGEIIRKYRKEKQLTQEEMAQSLGVTTPAVNKWEKGNSYPDISLLSPIARLLGISTDTLLSYDGNLSQEEEYQVLSQLFEQMRTENFDDVFKRAMGMVQKYPGNEVLIFGIAQTLDTYRKILCADNAEKYDEEILSLYERILRSENQDLVIQALIFLFYHYLNKEDYNKAEEYLIRMPKSMNGPMVNPKSLKANLCRRRGEREDAYRIYEELLYSSYVEVSQFLTALCSMAQEDKDDKRVRRLTDLRVAAAKLFEMGSYMELLPEFDVASAKKDQDKCIETLSEMMGSLEGVTGFVNSDLFSHMKKSPTNDLSNMAFMLKKSIEQDETMGFLRNDSRYKEMMEKLDAYMTK